MVRINYLEDWGKHLGLLRLVSQKYGSTRKADDQTNLFRYIHELYNKTEEEPRPKKKPERMLEMPGEMQQSLKPRDCLKMEEAEPDAIAL